MGPESQDSAILFSSGEVRLPSTQDRKPHDEISRLEAAASAARMNTADYLSDHLINSPSLFDVTIEDEIVKTIIPTSPFGYGGLMTFAGPRRWIQNDVVERVKTKTIYDFSTDTQLHYFSQLLAGLRAFHRTSLPTKHNEEILFLITENSMASVSNEQHHMGRTIALPHAHIVTASKAWIDETKEKPPCFRRKFEQNLLQSEKVFEAFKLFSDGKLKASFQDEVTLLHRTSSPFGYTLQTAWDINEGFPTLSKKLARLMESHHHLYVGFVENFFERASLTDRINSALKKTFESNLRKVLLPQPSYRVYMYVRDSKLAVTISPVILDTGGAFEANNNILVRNTQIESIYTSRELNDFHQEVVGYMQSDLNY